MSADRIDCPTCFKNGSQSGAYAIWAVEATVVVEVEEEEVVGWLVVLGVVGGGMPRTMRRWWR